jgi:hypothetical protein
MQATVTQTFDSLVQKIKPAVDERGFLSVCDRASALGLAVGKTDSKLALWYQFEGVDSTGTKLNLRARSYDPSGPTQVRAAVVRFTVTAIENGAITQQYEDEFEACQIVDASTVW